MKFRLNIIFSIVLHATIIAVALSLSLRNTSPHSSTTCIAVSLLKETTDSSTIFPQNTKRHKENNAPPDSSPRQATNSAALLSNENRPLNEIPMLLIEKSDNEIAVTTSGSAQDKSKSPEKQVGSFLFETRQERDTGNNVNIFKIIRAAIEKAKSYPLLARKRGIEGTVLVSFVINKNGSPHNIKIIKSSGYQILDEEVSKIIKRAAPFPEVNHEIVAPITFKLKESRVNP